MISVHADNIPMIEAIIEIYLLRRISDFMLSICEGIEANIMNGNASRNNSIRMS